MNPTMRPRFPKTVWRKYFDIILHKAKFELQAETEQTYLGFLWWIFEPLLFLIIYYLVFGLVLKTRTENFLSFLFIGLVGWRWFHSCVMGNAKSIKQNKSVMSQIHITKFVFPITGLLQDTFKFMIVFLIVLGFIIFFKSYPSIYWLALIPTLLLQFFLIVGFANLFAGITPFLPDLILVIESSLRGLMFMSGVFFNIEEKTSGMVEHCLKLNPMADILINYRRILLYHQWPEWGYMLYVFGFAVMVNAVGFLIIRRNDRIYPKVCL